MEEIVLEKHGGMKEDDVLNCMIKIDEYIDEGSVEIMKLSMRLELSQSELETAKHPSDLFHGLSKYYDHLEIVVARLMYALKILGHKRYGQRAIRELEQLPQTPETFHPDTDVKHGTCLENFYLHQCLALACRMVPNGESANRFVTHFANILKINPSTVSTPCEIIIKLIERDKICSKNQLNLLEEAFVKLNLSDSHIRDYTENCKRLYGSQWIASRSNSCTTINTRSIGVGTEQFSTKSYVNARVQGFAKTQFMCSLFWVLGSIPLYGILALVTTKAGHSLMEYLPNSTVIIANSSSLQVIQDARHHGDYEHEIEIYQVNWECEKLPADYRVHTITGNDNFSSINGTTIYALTGSYITLRVCGSTNSTNLLPRFEVAVVEGLEALQSPNTMLKDVFNFNFFYPGVNGEWRCKNVTFNIETFGYYTLVFLPQPEEARFNFSATFNHRFLNVSLLPVVRHYTLFEDQDGWHLPRTRWFNKKLCFVAVIKNNPNAPQKSVHIRRIYISSLWYTVGQFETVIGSLVCIFGYIAMIIYCISWSTRKRRI